MKTIPSSIQWSAFGEGATVAQSRNFSGIMGRDAPTEAVSSQPVAPAQTGAFDTNFAGPVDYRVILDSVEVGFIVFDSLSGHIIFSNAALRRRYGDVAGRPTCEYLGCRNEELCRTYCSRDLRDDRGTPLPAVSHERFIPEQGRWDEYRDQAIRWHDGRLVRLRVITDVTERKNAELAAIDARLAAERSNLAKTRFLANMSHEIRGPLNTILGFSELIRNEWVGPVGNDQYLQYAQYILTSGNHLLDVVNDILDIAKVESGKQDLILEKIDIERLLTSIMALFREKTIRSGTMIAVRCPPDLPHLIADERIVKQVLINLLSNAIHFTPSGGQIILKASAEPGGAIELTVEDNGAGIPKDQISRLIQPFEQLDNQYAMTRNGSGLGLFLVRTFMKLHGGDLRLESEPGQGTRATVRFPAKPDAADPVT